ncbi:MAG TPA: hypothetical protein VK508_20595 [Cyclobacteriaceae bacterium]|nr:hypothetical protein [Cyclobacteriaceae bacterium]
MTFLFAVVNLAGISLLSRWEWKRSAAADTLTYWSALALRLLGGLSIGLLYTYYYQMSGDTFVFFNDAAKLADLFYSDLRAYLDFIATGDNPVGIVTTEPRSIFFVMILSIVNLVTYNNYWLSSLWFSFFSFWCSYRLVLKLDSVFPAARLASRISLLFVPSVIFWSSGIIKESIAFGAVAILAGHFLSLIQWQKLKWTGYVGIALSAYLLLSLKYYWGAVLIPSIVSSLIVHWVMSRRQRSVWAIAGVWILVFMVICVAASFTHPNFYMERFLYVIVENHNAFVSISSPEDIISYYNLSADWTSIFLNTPWAFWSGLFRPMIFEAGSVTGIVAAVENLVLLVLVFWKLRSVRMPLPENRLIVMATVAYIAVLCIFLALSTPNFGTLSRYRVGFLPFFILLILKDHPVFRFIKF